MALCLPEAGEVAPAAPQPSLPGAAGRVAAGTPLPLANAGQGGAGGRWP